MEFQFQTPNNNNSARNIFKEENAFRENLKLISQNNTLYNNSNNYNIKPLTNTSLFSSQKEAEEETKLKSLLTKISNIFSEILSKYESEQSILYSILKEIIYSIKLIISEFSSNKETLENDNIKRLHFKTGQTNVIQTLLEVYGHLLVGTSLFEITALIEERDKKFENFTSVKRIPSKYYRDIEKDNEVFPIMPTESNQEDESLNENESFTSFESNKLFFYMWI